jgi:hypothetical protein
LSGSGVSGNKGAGVADERVTLREGLPVLGVMLLSITVAYAICEVFGLGIRWAN